MKIVKHIVFLLLASTLLGVNTLLSQNNETLLFIRVDNENGPVKLKWYSDKIVAHEGFNVYRQKQGVNDREKLNMEPLKPGAKPIPEAELTDELKGFSDVIIEPDFYVGKEPMLDFILMPYFIANEQFAQFAGIRFDDETAVKGSEYVYIIEEIKTGNEVEIVRSEPITAGELRMEAAPKEIISKSSNTKIKIGWKAEPERYYAVNIYRAPADNPDNVTKINEEPVRFNNEGGQVSKYPFQDLGLEEDAEFEYTLKTVDYFGLEAQIAKPVKFGTQDVIPPKAPYNIEIDGDDASLSFVLTWEAEIPDDFKSFSLFYSKKEDGEYVSVVEDLPAVQKTVDFEVDEPGEHYFKIQSKDVNGNATLSERVSKKLIDVIPPQSPQNVTTQADTGMVVISWDPVPDEDLMGYIVYRQLGDDSRPYNQFNRTPIKETSFTNQLPKNIVGGFNYKVLAVDTNGNKSGMSEAAAAVFEDKNPPPKPFLKPVRLNNDNLPVLKWQEIPAGDLAGVNVFRSTSETGDNPKQVNINLLRPGSKTYLDRSAEPGSEYYYYISAVDTAENVSPASEIKSIKTTSNDKIPAELKKFQIKRRGSKEINFSWEVDNPQAVLGYVLYGKGPGDKQLKPVTGRLEPGNSEYQIKKPAPGDHEFQLKVYDKAGNKTKSNIETIKIKN